VVLLLLLLHLFLGGRGKNLDNLEASDENALLDLVKEVTGYTTIRIDHYVHADITDDVAARLQRIEDKIDKLLSEGEEIMALDTALAKRLDDATNAIAARLTKMQGTLDAAAKAGGLTADQAAALSTALEGDISRLETMGKDPVNPIPSTP